MNGIYPFSGSDPGPGPGTPSSESSVINSPFGPTVGPLAESNTGATSPTSPSSTGSGSSSSSSTGSVDSNITEKGPRLLSSALRDKISAYSFPPLPKTESG